MGILSNLAKVGTAFNRVRKETINLVGTNGNALKLLEKAELSVLDEYIRKINNQENGPLDGELTDNEVWIGENNGKVSCIREYRNRTEKGIGESKQDVENYFRNRNLTFNYNYNEPPEPVNSYKE